MFKMTSKDLENMSSSADYASYDYDLTDQQLLDSLEEQRKRLEKLKRRKNLLKRRKRRKEKEKRRKQQQLTKDFDHDYADQVKDKISSALGNTGSGYGFKDYSLTDGSSKSGYGDYGDYGGGSGYFTTYGPTYVVPEDSYGHHQVGGYDDHGGGGGCVNGINAVLAIGVLGAAALGASVVFRQITNGAGGRRNRAKRENDGSYLYDAMIDGVTTGKLKYCFTVQ